jgi:hypothetical protein
MVRIDQALCGVSCTGVPLPLASCGQPTALRKSRPLLVIIFQCLPILAAGKGTMQVSDGLLARL